jgi:choline transport protein
MRVWGRLHGRQDIDSAYSLGKFGMLFNLVGILYLLFACITFNFPSTYPVNSQNMNYTCAAIGFCVAVAIVTWITTGRKQFTGPQVGAILTGRLSTESADVDVDADIKVHGKM